MASSNMSRSRELVTRASETVFPRLELLEQPDIPGRRPNGLLPEQHDQCLFEVAGEDALEIEARNQHLGTLRSAGDGRQKCRRNTDTLRAFTTIADAAHGDQPMGRDLIPERHQPFAAALGQLVGMSGEQRCNLRLNRLCLFSLSQPIAKCRWLRELVNVSLADGVLVPRWRGGGLEYPR
jgi:hypothetical protein